MTTEQAALAGISARVARLIDDLAAATSAEEAERLEAEAGAELVPMLEALYETLAPGAARGVKREVAAGRLPSTTVMTISAAAGATPLVVKLRIGNRDDRGDTTRILRGNSEDAPDASSGEQSRSDRAHTALDGS